MSISYFAPCSSCLQDICQQNASVFPCQVCSSPMYVEMYCGGCLVALSNEPNPRLRPMASNERWRRLFYGSLSEVTRPRLLCLTFIWLLRCFLGCFSTYKTILSYLLPPPPKVGTSMYCTRRMCGSEQSERLSYTDVQTKH